MVQIKGLVAFGLAGTLTLALGLVAIADVRAGGAAAAARGVSAPRQGGDVLAIMALTAGAIVCLAVGAYLVLRRAGAASREISVPPARSRSARSLPAVRPPAASRW